MAFLLLMFELYIVALSSSLSLNVISTFKEMATIGFGVLLFGDQINAVNGLGVLVTVGAIVGYNHTRYAQLKERARRARRDEAARGRGGETAGKLAMTVVQEQERLLESAGE